MLTKTQLVLGEKNLSKLQNVNLLIFGVGGVGGFVAEMFVRLGVKKITIVDFDNVDITNLNRQVIALNSNINQKKVDVFYERAQNINKNCLITKIAEKLTQENVQKFFNQKYDYVIDCIDDVNAKVCLAKYCYVNNINLISSMGTGNRYKGIPQFEVADIYKTSYDKLAKKIREMITVEKKQEKAKNKETGRILDIWK